MGEYMGLVKICCQLCCIMILVRLQITPSVRTTSTFPMRARQQHYLALSQEPPRKSLFDTQVCVASVFRGGFTSFVFECCKCGCRNSCLRWEYVASVCSSC